MHPPPSPPPKQQEGEEREKVGGWGESEGEEELPPSQHERRDSVLRLYIECTCAISNTWHACSIPTPRCF